MKKVLSVLLSFMLLCVLLSGCNGKTASDEKGNSSVQSSNAEQEEERVIHLVTDLGKNAEFWTDIEDDTAGAQNAIEQALKFIGNLPAGYKVAVEVLPTNEADYQSRLTNLRTEIMAGGGPDIFVLSTDDYGKMDSQKRLFPNPQKAMADGFFLPLDDYLRNAQYMELDKMNPTVTKAGCYENTQMVLPIRYSYGAAKINSNLPDPEAGWNEVMNSNDETMKSVYARAAKPFG